MQVKAKRMFRVCLKARSGGRWGRFPEWTLCLKASQTLARSSCRWNAGKKWWFSAGEQVLWSISASQTANSKALVWLVKPEGAKVQLIRICLVFITGDLEENIWVRKWSFPRSALTAFQVSYLLFSRRTWGIDKSEGKTLKGAIAKTMGTSSDEEWRLSHWGYTG